MEAIQNTMDTGTIVLLSVLGFIALAGLITLLSSFFTVKQAEVAVIERLGKFARVATSGLNWKAPFIESVVTRVSLRVRNYTTTVETKTKDNVFVKIPIAIQYSVIPTEIQTAVYKLANVETQISNYVLNTILGHMPTLTLDDCFANQSTIANDVKTALADVMTPFGWSIEKALITDVIPDEGVKAAMNDQQTQARAAIAAQSKGEADKILVVKAAEAQADAKALAGKGIANERKAIVEGLRESVEHFKESVEGASAQDVMALVLVTQYFDTMKEIGAKAGTNTLFFPSNPGSANDMLAQIVAGFKTTNTNTKAATASK